MGHRAAFAVLLASVLLRGVEHLDDCNLDGPMLTCVAAVTVAGTSSGVTLGVGYFLPLDALEPFIKKGIWSMSAGVSIEP